MNLDGPQIDKLKRVAYADLIAAGTGALRSVATELRGAHLTWDVIAAFQRDGNSSKSDGLDYQDAILANTRPENRRCPVFVIEA